MKRKNKSPQKSPFLTRISPFVFPNLTKTLRCVGGFKDLGKFFQIKPFFFGTFPKKPRRGNVSQENENSICIALRKVGERLQRPESGKSGRSDARKEARPNRYRLEFPFLEQNNILASGH